MDFNSSALVAAWGSLPREPAIAYYGEDSLIEGIKVCISEYQAFTEIEKLDALNTLVDSKHCLVIAPATCGTYVPISQMATEELVFSALLKPRNESASIIDSEIRPVFEELVTLLKDPEPAVSAQALDDIQDMVMDQTLRQISKGVIKYVFVYQDELMDCSVMVLGNRKTLSFDTKKIRSLQNKINGLLQVINTPAKTAQKKSAKPKPKKQSTSEDSSSETESSTSSESSSDPSSEDEGQRTPVILSEGTLNAPPKVAVISSAADNHAKDLLAAKNLLLEAQKRVEALMSVSVNYETAIDQPSGPALKTPAPVPAAPKTFTIPKKSAMLEKAESQHSRKSKLSKGARKAKKAAKKARKAKRKLSKREAKRVKKAKKTKRPASSESLSSSSVSSSDSSSDAPPPKDDQDPQV